MTQRQLLPLGSHFFTFGGTQTTTPGAAPKTVVGLPTHSASRCRKFDRLWCLLSLICDVSVVPTECGHEADVSVGVPRALLRRHGRP
jgi:hypothetical protein